jgi:formamidopyrimidine-DNA glycosylase
MPEGPEVIITTQYLYHKLNKKQIKDLIILGGRYYSNEKGSKRKILNGHNLFTNNKPLTIKNISSKGKFIYFTLTTSDNKVIYMMNTLGMSGNWSFYKDKFSRIKMKIYDAKKDKMYNLYFNDMRNFGTLEFTDNKKVLNERLDKLAVDILRSNITTDKLVKLMNNMIGKNRKTLNLVKLMMDQCRLVSGIGNYLVAEILYDAKLNPHRTLDDLTNNEKKALAYSMRKITKHAYYDNHTGYMIYYENFMNKHKKRVDDNLLEDYHDDIKIIEPFEFKVYRQKKDPYGNKVITDSIVKSRTIHYVKEIQK